jgi:hypothetical protein
METVAEKYRKKLMHEIKDLSPEKMKEVMGFVYFIKARDVIDPEQAYFWTKGWQEMEAQVDQDKAKGLILGNGTITDLLKELKK